MTIAERKKKHIAYMKHMETDNKHVIEENMYKELDEQKDVEYAQRIASRYAQ